MMMADGGLLMEDRAGGGWSRVFELHVAFGGVAAAWEDGGVW